MSSGTDDITLASKISINGSMSTADIKAVWEESTKTLVEGTASAKEKFLNTGAKKNDKEKPDLSLIPLISQIAEAKAFMVGEKKYGRYNYCEGHKASQLIAALVRHAYAWFEGEENDPVDGQPHLGSVKACVSMILRQQELGTLKDDRFKK